MLGIWQMSSLPTLPPGVLTDHLVQGLQTDGSWCSLLGRFSQPTQPGGSNHGDSPWSRTYCLQPSANSSVEDPRLVQRPG